MTMQGAKDLYMWLMVSWPLVIKPGASDSFVEAKVRELVGTYREYTDAEVRAAFQEWTENNEKYPTTKDILNELKWNRVKKTIAGRENEELWAMEFIKDDGSEWSYGSFRRSEFLNHPANRNKLQPEEWRRRFLATRERWYKKNGIGANTSYMAEFFKNKLET